MESLNRRLTLVVPDLVAPGVLPPATLAEPFAIALPCTSLDKAVPDTQSRALELELLLARGEREKAANNPEELLFTLFTSAAAVPLPTAAVTYLADTDRRTDGWLLRADPVYLQADNARVILLGNDYLNIQQEEAATLREVLRPLFETVGMQLEVSHPKRWYLRLRENPCIVFRSLREVLGHDIHAYLPDAKPWRSLLNEVQMALHESDINKAREARGEWPINSLWFWGGGTFPAAEPSPFTKVWSDEPLAVGLAKLAGAPHAALPSNAQEWLHLADTPGEHLVVMQRLGPNFFERFNTQWAAPLCAALRGRMLKSLSLYVGHGNVFHVNRSLLGRWWRRRRPLAFYR
ncbi:MAG: hypothetical protein HY028_10520 [Gammaproteobacteria bacterium]|nr:hypothetical protein [Gammaproteobacteria bacterium]